MSDPLRHRWRAIGASVRGAAHVRAGQPLQDAIGWQSKGGGDPLPLVMAVSDGHGSNRCFRSDAGARLAVETTVKVMADSLEGLPPESTLSSVKRLSEGRLPQELARTWKERVENALTRDPVSVEELDRLEQLSGPSARRSVEANPLLPYGATLLAVAVSESYALYLQLGDGDILVVSEDGEVSRTIPADERLFASETTSLCAPDAWRDMRVRFHAWSGLPPALILLATDGYANSFREDAGFLKIGSDLLAIARTEGLDYVERELESWLAEATRVGSGDDITLGALCRLDAVDAARGAGT